MRILIHLLLVLCVFNQSYAEPKTEVNESNVKKVRQISEDTGLVCGYEVEQVKIYLSNFINFALKLFLEVAVDTSANFIYTPSSVLLSLSALAEGSDNRAAIDDVLGLPTERCVKQQFYKLVLNRETPSLDVSFLRNKVLVIDETMHTKENWHGNAIIQFQQNVISAPIKRIPLTAARMIRQVINFQFQGLNLTGNSVLLDSMHYTGLWQNTFPELLFRQPFYNNDGNQTGWVDMMKTKIRARMAYSSEIKLKVIELPVGADGRYRMLLGQFIEKVDYIAILRALENNIIISLKDRLKESKVPIEVQIPRFNLNTELDIKKVLQKIGVNDLWTNPSVTKHIADIPALPSSYIQRTDVFIDIDGINPSHLDLVNTKKPDVADTGLDPAIGNEFIANKPILFGLFDAEFYTPHFLGSYEVPTYGL